MKKLISACVFTGLAIGCQSSTTSNKPKPTTPAPTKLEDKKPDDAAKPPAEKPKPNAN